MENGLIIAALAVSIALLVWALWDNRATYTKPSNPAPPAEPEYMKKYRPTLTQAEVDYYTRVNWR
jgi:hypothetical protein